MNDIESHDREIQTNVINWQKKPLLQKIYRGFHQSIAKQLAPCNGLVVELGSGVADITEVIPHCLRTDLFPNPWIDHVENAYQLTFADRSLSNLILFDVFHHLRYPGVALKEMKRVLVPGGRVIIFEPCVSLLGLIVYGLLHPEPLGLNRPIHWESPIGWQPTDIDYYAAQGNASRIFVRNEVDVRALGWHLPLVQPLCSLSYVASGGYSKPQMYPTAALPIMRKIDQLLGYLPQLFATRLMIVLEKPMEPDPSNFGPTP